MEPTAKFFQPAWVVNYPEVRDYLVGKCDRTHVCLQADVNWTRISEYKHSPNQPAGVKEHPGRMWSCCSSLNITTLVTFPGTVVYREYSTDVGDPYYPVPNKRNKDLYAKYQVCHLTSQD